MSWDSFSGAEVAALTLNNGVPFCFPPRVGSVVSFFADPGERDCPACGRRRLRAYVNSPAGARRPTLVSYVWCSACRKFVGTRARHPEGLVFSDPLAALSAEDRRELERSLVGFLAHLDRLWDAGVLPQTFTA